MKSLFKQFSGTYHKESDYMIPILALLYAEENNVEVYGQQSYLPYWQYRRITYINLLTSGNFVRSTRFVVLFRIQMIRFLPEVPENYDVDTSNWLLIQRMIILWNVNVLMEHNLKTKNMSMKVYVDLLEILPNIHHIIIKTLCLALL